MMGNAKKFALYIVDELVYYSVCLIVLGAVCCVAYTFFNTGDVTVGGVENTTNDALNVMVSIRGNDINELSNEIVGKVSGIENTMGSYTSQLNPTSGPCNTNIVNTENFVCGVGCPDGFFETAQSYDEKLRSCEIKRELYMTAEEWARLQELSMECKEDTLNTILDLENLKRNVTSTSCFNEVKARILYKKALSSWWSATYYLAKERGYASKEKMNALDDKNAKANDDYEKDMQRIYYLNNVREHINYFFSYIYTLKKEYPQYYSQDNLPLLYGEREAIEDYKQLDQSYNLLYDRLYKDANAKYFLKVDPNDPIVIYQTDKLTYGLSDEDIKWEILDFVRNNVRYKYDPNWKTDWVQSPSITLFSGEGDCDDFAVLLSSMFMRAGVKDVRLRLNDEHVWVSADGSSWDGMYRNSDKSAPDDLVGECYEINKYIQKLESQK